MDRSSLLEGEGLVAVGARAEKRTDRIEQATEVGSRAAMSEPAHRPISLFDAAMILLQMVVQVAIRPVNDLLPEHRADRSWIGVMPISRDPGRASHPSRSMRSGRTPQRR